ncbi:MAG: class I SAM-dependent methyltransferase [Bacteroidia bacterium]|nr:class I SAM-dependent methyltransferase [Bacteroidia bacterium]MBT8275574.1 class I SAM-dependent methyltransferase [Bacteroidia bacterium]NNF31499.1 class I SAM-dependent methyltransferase [Flavobacteriaceae bacterium]NNK54078.1 class I SAM-dependent methyltransferase [Flavobacteriaceae bacterium]NNM07655.1 class I SAM-dependent methyltransferase [Flavobacteriaceae bacterium]
MVDPDKASEFMVVKDFLVSGESFQLMHHPELDMLFTFPQPSADRLSEYYESEQYISHTDSGKGLIAWLYQIVKGYSLRKKVKLIDRINSGPGSLADIGAGTAAFLDAAKRRGWDVSGIEPNAKARGFAKEREIDLQESISNLTGMQFDVVTLWHVLEHLPDLENTILKISELVKPEGHLIIAVPNFKSYDAHYYKKYWAAFDVPRHLWHFSGTSVKKLFEGKLDFVQTKPMIFDSFYVSLLSEKYKNGNSFSLRALGIGLWSNISAWRSKEYSSRVYLFRKAN